MAMCRRANSRIAEASSRRHGASSESRSRTRCISCLSSTMTLGIAASGVRPFHPKSPGRMFRTDVHTLDMPRAKGADLSVTSEPITAQRVANYEIAEQRRRLRTMTKLASRVARRRTTDDSDGSVRHFDLLARHRCTSKLKFRRGARDCFHRSRLPGIRRLGSAEVLLFDEAG